MAVNYQSSTQVTWGASPRVITKPSGTADGDLLVLVIVNSNYANTCATPAGWTDVNRFQSSASNRTINVFYKVASSEGADYSITTPNDSSGFLFRIDGQSSSTPVYVSNAEEASNTLTPSINATITPSISNSLLIMIASSNGQGTPTDIKSHAIATSNPTWVEREELATSTATYGIVSIVTASRPETSATGNCSFTFTGGNSNIDSCAFMLAIQRSTLFTTSTLDTVTTSDVMTVMRDKFINAIETINLLEVLKVVKSRVWRSVSKPSTTWRKKLK